jgi:hypothetical protein
VRDVRADRPAVGKQGDTAALGPSDTELDIASRHEARDAQSGPVRNGPAFSKIGSMTPQRHGQVWLYHGGTPLRELLQPHGYKERSTPLENPEHDELNRPENEDPDERDEIQL